ncbi:ribonuclease P protein subunit p30 [Phlebotomus argentipes]|uniref:ribonuclease P protein subunit p30 n=1 Tax=Phlebotomus argentipes TaxID=94469 RepID=UPI00289381C9|nr:ribonuclease P protein subunit p30 [Phlebotomus argentipes]
MDRIGGFCDLCIPYTENHNDLKEIVETLIKLGYKNAAIEQQFDNTVFEKNKSTKRAGDVFQPPVNLNFLEQFRKDIKIYSRLTIIYSDNSISHHMGTSLNLKKYDIIAGLPKTEAGLQHCCQTFNGDIISFNTDEKFMKCSRKFYKLAVQRNVFFEIQYSPAILDRSKRRCIIRKAHGYYSLGKSENIIISSGATSAFQLRGPYDIACLGLIFGLSEEQSKNSMRNNCRSVLLRASGRRNGCTVVLSSKTTAEDSDSESSGEEMDVEVPCKKLKYSSRKMIE